MSDSVTNSVIPEKGWHVLHLFYRVEHGQWSMLSPEERITAKTQLTELIQEIRATENTQLLVFSVVTPKADICFMLLTPSPLLPYHIVVALLLSRRVALLATGPSAPPLLPRSLASNSTSPLRALPCPPRTRPATALPAAPRV